MKKRVLWLLAALVVLLYVLTVSAGAAYTVDSGTCGINLTWTLDSEGTLTIAGSGAMTCYSSSSSVPWYSSNSGITSVTIESGVTSISDYAFVGCDSLNSVTIPDGVTSIGSSAFLGCSSPISVTIPNGVTSIGRDAFAFCSSLTSVTIGDGVTSIGGFAFSGCSSLTSVTIGDGVTSIGNSAFVCCSSLISVTIPNSVTSIGDWVFDDCSSLTNITVAEDNASYKSQDGVLFNKDMTTLLKCPGGKSGAYTIPNSVTSIRGYAFYGCSSLTSVTIPNSVTSIGGEGWVFYGCPAVTAYGSCGSSLCYILHSSGVLQITGSGAMRSYSSYSSVPWYSSRSSIKSVIIGDGATSIGIYAFHGCDSLTSVTIPDGVTSIGSYAFYGCSNLADVYYTGTEEQWNAISIGSSNGPLTGAAIHFAEPEAPTVDAEVSLESGAAPEFTIDTTTITGTGNYAVITVGGKTVRVEQADWADGKITYSDIAMKDLTQTVTLGIYDAAGKLLAEQSVSVYEALKTRLDAETNIQKKVEYTAQLHLAAAAQKYFDHNVGNLASKDLDSTVGDMSEHRKDESSLSGKNKDIIYGTSCVLGNELQMKIYFTANDKDVFINGDKVELTASPTEGYYYYRMNVNPADIFESVSIEVKDGDTVLATARDSVASYCARLYAMGGEKNETLADALLNYGVAAKAAEV